jgi:hypothetical protein
MDEGNEVLVCASEYVKGRPSLTFEKLEIIGQIADSFADFLICFLSSFKHLGRFMHQEKRETGMNYLYMSVSLISHCNTFPRNQSIATD